MISALPEFDTQLELAGAESAAPQRNCDRASERFAGLQKELRTVAEGFADFDEIIGQYLQSARQPSYPMHNLNADADQMLSWMVGFLSLTPEQTDLIRFQQALYAVSELARVGRQKLILFQHMQSRQEELRSEFGRNTQLKVYLNPIRLWTTFLSKRLLNKYAEPPCRLIFFAHKGDTAAAILDEAGQRAIEELARFQPCTLDEWILHNPRAGRRKLLQQGRQLAEIGLVAWS